MKIHEMLFDSMKYPFYGWKHLIIVGLMILISSEILGQYNDLIIYLNINLPDVAILLISMMALVLLAVLTLFEAGYAFKIVEKSVHGIEKPPQFNNLVSMFKHGFTETVVGFIYFIIPSILLLIVTDDIFTEIDIGMPPIALETSILLMILAVVLGFVADIIFTVAIPHMASKSSAFKDAFSFGEIFRKIRQIGLKKLIIAYLSVIMSIVIIGGPILEEVIASANIFGFVVAELLFAPYLLMFYARFTALLYRS